MLKTETNTPHMQKQVLKAARKKFGKVQTAFFEHGQWWIALHNGAQYSVVDAEGDGAIDGLDFEEVTGPDEEH